MAVATPTSWPTVVVPPLLPTLAATPVATPMPATTTTPAPVPTSAPLTSLTTATATVVGRAAPTREQVSTPTPTPVPPANPSPTPIPPPSEFGEFWNRAKVGQDGEPFPSCGDSIFTHPVVEPDDATPFLWVEDVYPHEQMVYWATPRLNDEGFQPAGVLNSEQVQLYAPADIYFMQVWRGVRESHDGGTSEDWGKLTVICDGYSLSWGHVGRPIEEILDAVRKTVPVEWSSCPMSTSEEALVTTEVGDCVWRVFFNPPISAGTPSGNPAASQRDLTLVFSC